MGISEINLLLKTVSNCCPNITSIIDKTPRITFRRLLHGEIEQGQMMNIQYLSDPIYFLSDTYIEIILLLRKSLKELTLFDDENSLIQRDTCKRFDHAYLKIQAHLNRKITHVNVNSLTIYKKVEGLHLLGRPQQGDLKYSKL